MIEAPPPDVRVETRAATEAECGLVLSAAVPDGVVDIVRAALDRLPSPFDIVAA